MSSIVETGKGGIVVAAAALGAYHVGNWCGELCSIKHIVDLSDPLLNISVRGGKDWTQIFFDTARQIDGTTSSTAFYAGGGIFAVTTFESAMRKETRPWELDGLRGACLGAALAGLTRFALAKADSSSSSTGLHILAATISGCISGTASGLIGHLVGSTLRKLNLVPNQG